MDKVQGATMVSSDETYSIAVWKFDMHASLSALGFLKVTSMSEDFLYIETNRFQRRELIRYGVTYIMDQDTVTQNKRREDVKCLDF